MSENVSKDKCIELVIRALITPAKIEVDEQSITEWTRDAIDLCYDLVQHVAQTFDYKGKDLILINEDDCKFNIPTLLVIGLESLFKCPGTFLQELEIAIRLHLQ